MPVIALSLTEIGLPLTVTGQASTTPPAIRTADDRAALLALLRDLIQPADIVFIKASRSVGLENFATTLQDSGPHTTATRSPGSRQVP